MNKGRVQVAKLCHNMSCPTTCKMPQLSGCRTPDVDLICIMVQQFSLHYWPGDQQLLFPLDPAEKI